MKNFLKFMAIVFALGLFSACNKNQANNIETSEANLSYESVKTLIDSELSSYSKDDFNVEEVRRVLINFNETLNQAYQMKMEDNDEISSLFVNNASNAGLVVYSNAQVEKVLAARGISAVPTGLIKLLGELVDTADTNSIDGYISNLNAFYSKVKNSNEKALIKYSILGSVITLKVIAKIVKLFNPEFVSPDVKWKRQLKCAFKSLAAGLAGSLKGCSEGASIVGSIGSLGGTKGVAIGSIVGCTVGAVISGIINIAKTAQSCVKEEGL